MRRRRKRRKWARAPLDGTMGNGGGGRSEEKDSSTARFPRRAKEANFLSRNEEGALLLLILFVRVLSRDDNKVLA